MATWTLRYQQAFGHALARPYLILNLKGINGAAGNVIGLLDSGADNTTLPLEFASLMGYTAAELELDDVGQVSGTARMWKALRPCDAIVVGIAEVGFTLKPWFIDGSQMPLWGRCDFMREFAVTVDEVGQQFQLHRADPVGPFVGPS